MTGIAGEMISRIDGFEQWKVFSTEEPYDAVFARDKLVYLSPESPNLLTEIDPEKVSSSCLLQSILYN